MGVCRVTWVNEFPTLEGWQARPDGVVLQESQNGEGVEAHSTNHPALPGTPPMEWNKC